MKRAVLYIEQVGEQAPTIQVFTTLKKLLAAHPVAPYDTIVNHLTRRQEAFTRGGVTIQRVEVNPTVQTPTVTVTVRAACWGQYMENVADRLSDDPAFDKSSPLFDEAETLMGTVSAIHKSKRVQPVEVTRELLPYLIDEVRNQAASAADASTEIDQEERPRARRAAKILTELLDALIDAGG